VWQNDSEYCMFKITFSSEITSTVTIGFPGPPRLPPLPLRLIIFKVLSFAPEF
jgi:hypothetical protein